MSTYEATDDEAVLGLAADEQLGMPNPYNEDKVTQEDYHSEHLVKTLISLPEAPKTTKEAAEFLRLSSQGPLEWKQLCLKLQRIARGLPAVFPSAAAAAVATPLEDRVTKIADLRRGMVAYSDDPTDSNPYGHIYFIAGRDTLGRVLTWTNDALRPGGVDIVPIDFFAENWGDRFQFGAVSLNGYDFSDLEARPEPKHPTLGANYNEAIERVQKSVKYHRDAGHVKLVRLLKQDLKVMKERRDFYS